MYAVAVDDEIPFSGSNDNTLRKWELEYDTCDKVIMVRLHLQKITITIGPRSKSKLSQNVYYKCKIKIAGKWIL